MIFLRLLRERLAGLFPGNALLPKVAIDIEQNIGRIGYVDADGAVRARPLLTRLKPSPVNVSAISIHNP